MVESGMEKVATLRHGRIKVMNAGFSVRGDVEWRQRATCESHLHLAPPCFQETCSRWHAAHHLSPVCQVMPADAHEQRGRRCVRVVPLCVHERVAQIVVVAEGLNCLVQCLQAGLWPQVSPQTNAKSFISWSATLATSSFSLVFISCTAGEACHQVSSGQQHLFETRCRGAEASPHAMPQVPTHMPRTCRRLKPCDSLLSHGAPLRLERVALCHHQTPVQRG